MKQQPKKEIRRCYRDHIATGANIGTGIGSAIGGKIGKAIGFTIASTIEGAILLRLVWLGIFISLSLITTFLGGKLLIDAIGIIPLGIIAILIGAGIGIYYTVRREKRIRSIRTGRHKICALSKRRH